MEPADCHLAKYQNAVQTAHDAGHDFKVLKQHYDALSDPDESCAANGIISR